MGLARCDHAKRHATGDVPMGAGSEGEMRTGSRDVKAESQEMRGTVCVLLSRETTTTGKQDAVTEQRRELRGAPWLSASGEAYQCIGWRGEARDVDEA